jgi:hypothetical protein
MDFIYLYSSETSLSDPLRKYLKFPRMKCFSVDSAEVRNYLLPLLGSISIPCLVIKQDNKPIRIISDTQLMKIAINKRIID